MKVIYHILTMIMVTYHLVILVKCNLATIVKLLLSYFSIRFCPEIPEWWPKVNIN